MEAGSRPPRVLGHRIILKPEYRLRKETPQTVIEEILSSIEVPSNIGSYQPKRTEEM